MNKGTKDADVAWKLEGPLQVREGINFSSSHGENNWGNVMFHPLQLTRNAMKETSIVTTGS